VRIYALCVTALEEAPVPAEILRGCVAGRRGTPVGTRLLTQPGPPLGATLACQEIAQAHPQSDTAYQDHPCGRPELLGLCEQPFSKPRLASERPAGRGENRLCLPTQRSPGVVQEVAGLSSIVDHVPTDQVPTLFALLRVQQIHQPCPEPEASEQPHSLHRLLLLIIMDYLITREAWRVVPPCPHATVGG
jgi:hypothetical protein